MLYSVAHLLRDKMGWLWNLIEWLNSMLFSIRYGKRLRGFRFTSVPEGYDVVKMGDVQTEQLVSFFEKQPKEAFTFFHPHGFDAKSISRLQGNRAFLAYVLKDATNGQIAGYCFNRSFFHGVGYRGRMVDIGYRGKGLGTAMNKKSRIPVVFYLKGFYDDAEALAKVIQKLHDEPDFYRQVAEKCYERAKQFDISEMVARYNKVYEG